MQHINNIYWGLHVYWVENYRRVNQTILSLGNAIVYSLVIAIIYCKTICTIFNGETCEG